MNYKETLSIISLYYRNSFMKKKNLFQSQSQSQGQQQNQRQHTNHHQNFKQQQISVEQIQIQNQKLIGKNQKIHQDNVLSYQSSQLIKIGQYSLIKNQYTLHMAQNRNSYGALLIWESLWQSPHNLTINMSNYLYDVNNQKQIYQFMKQLIRETTILKATISIAYSQYSAKVLHYLSDITFSKLQTLELLNTNIDNIQVLSYLKAPLLQRIILKNTKISSLKSFFNKGVFCNLAQLHINSSKITQICNINKLKVTDFNFLSIQLQDYSSDILIQDMSNFMKLSSKYLKKVSFQSKNRIDQKKIRNMIKSKLPLIQIKYAQNRGPPAFAFQQIYIYNLNDQIVDVILQ